MSDKKYTLKQVINSRTEEKVKIDNLDIWVRFIIRPVSFVLTFLILKVKVTANQASFISMLISFLGLILVLFFHENGVLWALFVFNFWIIFDAVDGNIARVTNTFSDKGTYVDAISGYLYLMILYITLGLGLYYQINDIKYLVLGFTISIMTIFPRLVLQKKMAMFGSDKSDVSSKKEYGFKEKIALNIAGPAGLMNPLMLVAYFTDTLQQYLIFYGIIQTVLGILTIFSTFRSVLVDAK